MPKKKEPHVLLLEEIHMQLKRQNSIGYSLLLGIMRGLGTALGATVLVAIVTSVALQFTGSAEISAFIQAVVRSLGAGG